MADEEYFEDIEKKKETQAAAGVQVREQPVDNSHPRLSPSSSSEGATVVQPTAGEDVEEEGQGAKGAAVAKKRQFAEFVHYFSEWRHFKILLGTCMCWFLLDIA